MIKKQKDTARQALLRELEEARRQVEAARQRFDYAEGDMLDSVIYEMKAADERYGWLLREYRARERSNN